MKDLKIETILVKDRYDDVLMGFAKKDDYEKAGFLINCLKDDYESLIGYVDDQEYENEEFISMCDDYNVSVEKMRSLIEDDSFIKLLCYVMDASDIDFAYIGDSTIIECDY